MSKKKETKTLPKKAEAKKTEPRKPVAKKPGKTTTDKGKNIGKKSSKETFANVTDFCCDIGNMANIIRSYSEEMMDAIKNSGSIQDKDGKTLPKDELKKVVAALRQGAKALEKLSRKYIDFDPGKLLKILGM